MIPIPGPPPTPILGWRGNAISILRDPIVNMRRLYQTYGPVVGVAEGHTQFVLVFSPDYIQQVLSNPDLFYTNETGMPIRLPEDSAMARLASGGLLQMNGEKHKQQRRLMMPAFHKKRIEAYRDVIVALTEQRLASWQAGQTRDIFLEMQQLTLSIATKALLGLDPDREGEATRLLMQRWMKSFGIATMLLPFNLPGLPYRRFLTLSERLAGNLQAIIERKRASGIDEGDALSMLLRTHDEDGTSLTGDELLGQTSTLFVAGHETTAGTLTWTLFLLSQHPHVMVDLLNELDGKLPDAAPSVEQLGDLPMLDQVIKESMRLFPSLFWSLRIGVEPFELGPYRLPKGTSLIVSPAITHRIPDLYPQPDRFLPERWQMINPSPYEYLPFGGGPRMCLGAGFAMLEMKIVLPMILRRYRLTLLPGARVDHTGIIFLVPKGGLPMVIDPHPNGRLSNRRLTKSDVRGSVRSIVDLR